MRLAIFENVKLIKVEMVINREDGRPGLAHEAVIKDLKRIGIIPDNCELHLSIDDKVLVATNILEPTVYELSCTFDEAVEEINKARNFPSILDSGDLVDSLSQIVGTDLKKYRKEKE